MGHKDKKVKIFLKRIATYHEKTYLCIILITINLTL